MSFPCVPVPSPPFAPSLLVWLRIALFAAVAGSVALLECRCAEAGTVRLTLAEAVSRALHDAPDAKIARLEADRAADQLSAAQSSLWPHLSVTSRAGYSNRLGEELEVVDGSGRLRRYDLSSLGSTDGWFNFEIRQLLFDLSEWKNLERTQLEVETAQVAQVQRRELISFEVLERYSAVLRLERLLEVFRRRVRDAEWLEEQAAALLKVGRSLPAQREQIAVSLEEAQVEALLQAEELADARADLCLVMGEAEETGATYEVVPESVPMPEDVAKDSAAEQDVLASPEMRVLDLRRRMEQISVSATRAEAFPTLGVVAGYSHYGVNRLDNYSDELHVGVGLRIPLFEGFRIQHSVAGAVKTAEIARLRTLSVLESKRARVRDLGRHLVAAQRRSELARRRRDLAEKRLQTADLNLRAQQGSLEQALAARAESAREARAAIDAHFERITLWAQLKRETGTLAATVLGEVNAPTELDER